MKLSPRNRILALGAACLIGVVLLGVVLIAPSLSKMTALDADIVLARQEAEAASTLLDRRRDVKDQAAATSANLMQLSVAMPESPDVPGLIIDLHDAARDSGVVLRSVVPEIPVIAEGVPYQSIPIQAEVRGTWADAIDFLNRLAKLTRQVRINGFASTVLPAPAAEDAADTGLSFPPYYQVDMRVVVTAYTIPPPPPPVPEATATVEPAAE